MEPGREQPLGSLTSARAMASYKMRDINQELGSDAQNRSWVTRVGGRSRFKPWLLFDLYWTRQVVVFSPSTSSGKASRNTETEWVNINYFVNFRAPTWKLVFLTVMFRDENTWTVSVGSRILPLWRSCGYAGDISIEPRLYRQGLLTHQQAR